MRGKISQRPASRKTKVPVQLAKPGVHDLQQQEGTRTKGPTSRPESSKRSYKVDEAVLNFRKLVNGFEDNLKKQGNLLATTISAQNTRTRHKMKAHGQQTTSLLTEVQQLMQAITDEVSSDVIKLKTTRAYVLKAMAKHQEHSAHKLQERFHIWKKDLQILLPPTRT